MNIFALIRTRVIPRSRDNVSHVWPKCVTLREDDFDRSLPDFTEKFRAPAIWDVYKAIVSQLVRTMRRYKASFRLRIEATAGTGQKFAFRGSPGLFTTYS